MPEFQALGRFSRPNPGCEMPISKEKLTTGEPDAGDPHVRFGGRGGRDSCHPYLYPFKSTPCTTHFPPCPLLPAPCTLFGHPLHIWKNHIIS